MTTETQPQPSPTAQAAPAAGAVAGHAMPAEFLRSVIALCTQRGYSPENIEAWSKDDKWVADLWRKAEQMLAAAPSPTAQAAECVPALDRDRIREIFMAHGFTVKEGQTDLKQYVYDAAEALLRAARAPADSALEGAARESEYQRGYRHGYEQRDAEVRGALA